MAKTVMITLKKSPIGCLPKQRATLKAYVSMVSSSDKGAVRLID